MAGPILNPKCEIIPLQFVVSEHRFLATPETLPLEIGRRITTTEPWNLWSYFRDDQFMAYFDAERVVHYESGNHTPWRACHSDALLITFPSGRMSGDTCSWRGDAIILGPGWEGLSADIYWAVARALRRYFRESDKFNTEKDRMVGMALEGMMRSHGRI